MTTFRPQFQKQGPASNCVINGKQVGWLSCTAYAFAMLIDRSTLGVKRPSGCAVRRGTGDTVGGTTLRQCADVARDDYDVSTAIFTGSDVIRPHLAAAHLKAGRPIVLQGNAGAMVGTPRQSTNGPVNHAVLLNEGRGWDGDIPEDVLVYDPAADGRRDMDQGPAWWSWPLVLKFAAYLEPRGDGTPRLGYGWWYAAIGPDTEPHVQLRFGARKTSPFPDRTRADAPGRRVRVHSTPTTSDDTVIGSLGDNELFVAYQVTDKGDSFRGSKRWYGDQSGRRWVHNARLNFQGGST